MCNVALPPPSAGSWPRVPLTSCIALHRFVWAVQLDADVGTRPLADCDRAALSVWLRRLYISVGGSESGAPASSPDEEMLDWLVASVRRELIPRGVLLWFFPDFGDPLYCMIHDCVGDM